MAIVVESDIIDHLRLMVRERKEALSAAEQALTAAIIDACPVKEGDEVYARVYRGGYVWLPVLVRKVYVKHQEPRFEVSQRNTNGEWSKRVQTVNVREVSVTPPEHTGGA